MKRSRASGHAINKVKGHAAPLVSNTPQHRNTATCQHLLITAGTSRLWNNSIKKRLRSVRRTALTSEATSEVRLTGDQVSGSQRRPQIHLYQRIKRLWLRGSSRPVAAFKIDIPALLQKTPKSIVQVGGKILETNGHWTLWLEGAKSWNSYWYGHHRPVGSGGREEVTGCFDSQPPVNGGLSTELGSS